MQFLNSISIPQLTQDQSRDCKLIMSEKDLLLVLKTMPNNKCPSNDSLTKEFYEFFWDDLKLVFNKDELTNSQKQQ